LVGLAAPPVPNDDYPDETLPNLDGDGLGSLSAVFAALKQLERWSLGSCRL
jgi:hypothetical protein